MSVCVDCTHPSGLPSRKLIVRSPGPAEPGVVAGAGPHLPAVLAGLGRAAGLLLPGTSPGVARRCHAMPHDATRCRALLPAKGEAAEVAARAGFAEAGASPRLQAGSRRVQRRCQAVEGCLACLGWHGCCCPPAPVPSHFWLSPDTSDWQWGLSSLGMRAGPLPLPAARPLARLLSPVADGKPLGYIFCITPSPCWCVGSKALMEGAFIAALVQISRPQTQELADPKRPAAQEPRAPPRTHPLEQAAFPCTTVRPQTETYVTGRRPGKIINFLESFFNGKERRKTPSDILISPWIILVPWCLSATRPRRS